MKKVNVIGASCLIGSHFIDNNTDYELVCYSRNNKNYHFLDLKDEFSFVNYAYENPFLISFAPIWLTLNLLTYLEKKNLDKLKNLKGLVLFSSTSALTKRFASNEYDKKLAKKLIYSEQNVFSICEKYSINCKIIRPTIIYGVYKDKNDNNFVSIIKIFKKIPICFIPNSTGYRQPIHFSQLSNLVNLLLKRIDEELNDDISKIIEVGGDEELTYKDLLFRLSKIAQKYSKKKCILITVPNKLFFLFLSPLLILRPKLFDALYRMQADLSGFPKYSLISGDKSSSFPKDSF